MRSPYGLCHCIEQHKCFQIQKLACLMCVIFDEASQCDIRGLTIGYLGKNCWWSAILIKSVQLVFFQDLEKTFELISRFLSDIPLQREFFHHIKPFWSRKIRIPNMIQLMSTLDVSRNYCFSNHHIYDTSLSHCDILIERNVKTCSCFLFLLKMAIKIQTTK